MSKNLAILVAVIILGAAVLVWYINTNKGKNMNVKVKNSPDKEIRYVAIGDSYTIGLGIEESGRWPNVLVKNLKEQGINIILVANPSISGYEVSDATLRELPQIKNLKASFATVLIGANDSFRGETVENYRRDLMELLDQLQSVLVDPGRIVLITIPDWAKSPNGVSYGTDETVSQGIEKYNNVIKEEARSRGLVVADIFPISQTMTGVEDYISDGLHPSAEGYAKWERVIFPIVFELLR